jgi:hypothetical protein
LPLSSDELDPLDPLDPLLLAPEPLPELPDIPPELLPELPDIPPEPLLPELPDLPPLELPELPELPEDPDEPGLVAPTFPLSPSVWPLGEEALRLEPDCPSPCDEPPRSRLELLDEPLDPPLLPLDEPEVFWSRSAIVLSSEMLWTPSVEGG